MYTQAGTDVNPQMCADKINKYIPESVRIESNMGGSMYRSLLKPLVSELTQLLSIRAKSNKHVRIQTLAGFIKEFCYFRDDGDEEYQEFMKNFMAYFKDGTSDHDDAPDAVTGLCAFIRRSHQGLYPAQYLQDKDGYSEKES